MRQQHHTDMRTSKYAHVRQRRRLDLVRKAASSMPGRCQICCQQYLDSSCRRYQACIHGPCIRPHFKQTCTATGPTYLSQTCIAKERCSTRQARGPSGSKKSSCDCWGVGFVVANHPANPQGSVPMFCKTEDTISQRSGLCCRNGAPPHRQPSDHPRLT